jgi:DNA-binding MarR family transcriptional regulator
MVQQTNKFPHDFLQKYLGLISQYVPGDTTLNQIRIIQYIVWRSASDKGYACNTEICDALGMSAATVTRAICAGTTAGIISEEEDPRDGRRRLVMMSKKWWRRATLDQKAIELARQYFADG